MATEVQTQAGECSTHGSVEATARDAMRLAMHKLPIKTRFVVRQEEA